MKSLKDILLQQNPDDVWSDISDAILASKDSEKWNRVERNVVILGGMDRWVLNGGFETYLCMPNGQFAGEAQLALMDIGNQAILNALNLALSVFPGMAHDDLTQRQKCILGKNEKEI